MTQPFDSLGLRSEFKEALAQMAYLEMTPIQAQSLPPMMEGRDVIGQAQTGSGKTAAFGLALLHQIDPQQMGVQGLILCPTRELAEQVAAELRRLAQRLPNTRIMTACGGRPYRDQMLALKRGSHVVVGTPGRIGKHLRTQALDASTLRVLVLDEADRMLDMGFIDQVDEIVRECPSSRQTLLFSATFPEQISSLSSRVQRDPLRVTVETQVASRLLKQRVYMCSPRDRHQLIADLLAEVRPSTALVFCETREDCKQLGDFLTGRGAVALSLHGDMEQRDRDDVLLQFANGSASVLVATNLASRGIDIPSLPLVVVSELSHDPESHLHRIGRTGRAGEEGLALTIVAGPREEERLDSIEEHLGYRIPLGNTPRRAGGLDFLKPPNRTVLILSGRKDKLRKGDVLGSLVKDGGIPAKAIGRIDLMPKVCAVAIEAAYLQQAIQHLRTGRVKNKRVRVQVLD
jgi:ATP-independent RNA helicase DbpA